MSDKVNVLDNEKAVLDALDWDVPMPCVSCNAVATWKITCVNPDCGHAAYDCDLHLALYKERMQGAAKHGHMFCCKACGLVSSPWKAVEFEQIR